MQTGQVEIGKMERQLKQWGARLDDLAAKITTAGANAQANRHELVAELRAKHDLAQAKLDELKAAGGDKWEKLKTGVEGAYKELEGAWKKLTN